MSEKMSDSRFEELPVDEHITLRAVAEDDADDLFSITDSSREYLAEFLPWVNNTHSAEDSLGFIRQVKAERAEGSQFGFGVYYDTELVGHASLMHVTDDQSPEIGYWISQKFSGKGITTKVAAALTQFGFATLGLDEIVIKARVDNGPSNAIPPKLGYELMAIEHKEDESINIWRKAE